MINPDLRVRFERWRLARLEAEYRAASRPIAPVLLDYWINWLGLARWRLARAVADRSEAQKR